VDIIVLSILSALTSGPLVIQRQLKPLFDFNVDQIPFILSMGALGIGTLALLLSVLLERPFPQMLAVYASLKFMMIMSVLLVHTGISLGLVFLLAYLFVTLLPYGLQDFTERLRRFIGPTVTSGQDEEEVGNEEEGISLDSFKPRKTTNPNHGLPYDPTLPRLPWHPKISPYRFMVFSMPLAIGTVKAVLSQKGSVTTPITLEWISGVVIFLV
jgi:hypothetical protein